MLDQYWRNRTRFNAAIDKTDICQHRLRISNQTECLATLQTRICNHEMTEGLKANPRLHHQSQRMSSNINVTPFKPNIRQFKAPTVPSVKVSKGVIGQYPAISAKHTV